MTAATSNALTVTLQGDNDIIMKRSFNAPRELVYDVLSKPEHIRHWWGLRSTPMITCEMDFRVGGAWRFASQGPDGQIVAFYGEIREIERPERMVYTEIFEPFPDVVSVVTALLAEESGRTHLTVIASYPNAEVRDMVISSGMESGAAESYDRMEELLATLAATPA